VTKRHNRKHGLSRRLGVNLWGGKSPVTERNYPPGQHGVTSGYKRQSNRGVQLLAKQKLRGYYGNINERQFRNIYKEAARRKGNTEQNLIGLLESRLDAMVYRAGFVSTVFAARQFVNHGHVLVNGKKANIASYRLRPGDVVEIKEGSRQLLVVQSAMQSTDRDAPSYIEVDAKKFAVKYIRMPEITDVPYPVKMEPHLVIEYYSR
jgi:small subunit ribosomal protein S4